MPRGGHLWLYRRGDDRSSHIYALPAGPNQGARVDSGAATPGRQVHHFETQRVRKDGTVIDVSLSVFPIRGGADVIVAAAAVTWDVTERNWAEAEQRAAEAGRQESARIETAIRLAGRDGH